MKLLSGFYETFADPDSYKNGEKMVLLRPMCVANSAAEIVKEGDPKVIKSYTAKRQHFCAKNPYFHFLIVLKKKISRREESEIISV